MDTQKDAIQRNTLVDDTAEKVRQMILSGEVQPGECLPSRKDLAARFGVGLSTVHEAIQSLAAVGLVDSRPGKGTWVRRGGADSLLHPAAVSAHLRNLNARMLHEARSVIEIATTELAAQRATPEDVKCIWDALKSMEDSIEGDSFVEADFQFHLAVAKASHNDLLVQFYHVARKLFSEIITDLASPSVVRRHAMQIQTAVAQYIEKHDAGKARQTAQEHMEYVNQLISDGDAADDEWAH